MFRVKVSFVEGKFSKIKVNKNNTIAGYPTAFRWQLSSMNLFSLMTGKTKQNLAKKPLSKSAFFALIFGVEKGSDSKVCYHNISLD